MRLYVDANAVIRATEGRDETARLMRAILRHGEGASIIVTTSLLTIAETLVGPLKRLTVNPADIDAERLVTIYTSMMESHTAIETAPVEAAVLFNAAKLRADHGTLKLPDAIHLASAMWAKADVLISGDRRLLSIARAHLAVCALESADLDVLLARIASAP